MTPLVLRIAVCVLCALVVRAAAAQNYGLSPGQRGDPYSPSGPQPQVQTRYPLPQPPLRQPAQPTFPPQQQFQPQPQQAGYVPAANNPPTAIAPPPSDQLFQPTEVVAIVGNQFILYGEVAPTVEQILAPVLPQVKTDEDRRELEKVRQTLTRQVVRQVVDTKLMYLEFERQIEANAGRDKLIEARKDIARKMQGHFESELAKVREQIADAKPEKVQELMRRDPVVPRLAMLMKQNNAETLGELDAVLRQYGSSLEKQIRFFGENALGRQMIPKHVDFSPEVTHQDLLDYYEQHAAEFAVAAKARFEILTVKLANFPPTEEGRRAAWNLLAQMGNEVFFNNNFAAVARRHSQEPNAQRGGLYDWTTQGSLASKPIDQAIFTLEPGKLSQIIEDERGFHIVRVIERQDAGAVSFLEAQPSIKKAIEAQKKEADYKKFVEMLRMNTEVWTIYDEAHLARQPGAVLR